MEEGLVAGVIAIFLGMLAVFVGWTIIGGLGLGLVALLLAMHSYRKGHKILGTVGILFACVGLIEGILVAGMVGLYGVLTTPAKTGIGTLATVKTETMTTTMTTAKIIGKAQLRNGITFIVDNVNVTDKFIVKEFRECYACSAKPRYKIVIVHFKLRNDGIREATTPFKSNFEIEVDKGYRYKPISPSTYNRQSWKISESECLQYYCKPEWAFSLLPEEEDEGCLFFEILATTNPTKLIYNGLYGDFTIPLTG